MIKTNDVKIINKSQHATTEENILMNGNILFNGTLKADEIGLYLTLIVLSDEGVITKQTIYESCAATKTEINRILSELLLKRYIELEMIYIKDGLEQMTELTIR